MRHNSGSALSNHTLCINNNKKVKTTTRSTIAAAAITTDNNTPHETNCIKH
jgi:hypothetical protein